MATLVLRGFGQVFVAAAGLPRHRLYDLRHTSATHLLADGAPITYVAAPLGHRKPTTTPAFYAHWIPRGDKTYIDRLAAARQIGRASCRERGACSVESGHGVEEK